MHPILYAALCVVVPTAWGVGVYLVSNVIERLASERGLPPAQPVDYDI